MGTITIQRASGFWLYLPSYVKGAWRGHTGAQESVLSQPPGAILADFWNQPQSARHQQQGQTHHWPSSSPQKTVWPCRFLWHLAGLPAEPAHSPVQAHQQASQTLRTRL